jgi:hypothetical protein
MQDAHAAVSIRSHINTTEKKNRKLKKEGKKHLKVTHAAASIRLHINA